MTQYRAAIVHKSLREITPRRALDRANATGQWFKFYIPVTPCRGRSGTFGSWKTQAAAEAAITRYIKKWPSCKADDWRGLVWMRHMENQEAVTMAV